MVVLLILARTYNRRTNRLQTRQRRRSWSTHCQKCQAGYVEGKIQN